MGKTKVIIEPGIKEKIINSKVLSDSEKKDFLKLIEYLTPQEREELLLII